MGTILDNFRLWLQISSEWIEISKIRKASDHVQPLPCWAKKLNFGQLTRKLQACILTHSKFTMHLLCGQMQFHLGHVTLLGAEFQSLKLSLKSDLRHQAASCWALLQISSFGCVARTDKVNKLAVYFISFQFLFVTLYVSCDCFDRWDDRQDDDHVQSPTAGRHYQPDLDIIVFIVLEVLPGWLIDGLFWQVRW